MVDNKCNSIIIIPWFTALLGNYGCILQFWYKNRYQSNPEQIEPSQHIILTMPSFPMLQFGKDSYFRGVRARVCAKCSNSSRTGNSRSFLCGLVGKRG